MSLINDENLQVMGKIRKNVLRGAIWLLIAGVVVGVILILCNDVEAVSEIIAKTMGTIFLVALMMIVSVINFRLIEKKRNSVQVFSLISLCTSILWVILWIFAIWGWKPFFYSCVRDESACTQYYNNYSYQQNYRSSQSTSTTSLYCPDYIAEKCELTVLFKITAVITEISADCLIAALIMNMYEGKRKDLIRPLKIVAVSLAGYLCFYACLMTMIGTGDTSGLEKMGMLAGFASSIWFLVVIVAWVISHVEKNRERTKKNDGVVSGQAMPVTQNGVQNATLPESQNVENQPQQYGKSDAELRAEIEKKMRREMIEKEVRAQIEREQKQNMVGSQMSPQTEQQMEPREHQPEDTTFQSFGSGNGANNFEVEDFDFKRESGKID